MGILSYFCVNGWYSPYVFRHTAMGPCWSRRLLSKLEVVIYFELFCHSGGKQTFMVADNGFFFLLLEECTKSVAMMIRIGDGLCKSNSEEGLVWK